MRKLHAKRMRVSHLKPRAVLKYFTILKFYSTQMVQLPRECVVRAGGCVSPDVRKGRADVVHCAKHTFGGKLFKICPVSR